MLSILSGQFIAVQHSETRLMDAICFTSRPIAPFSCQAFVMAFLPDAVFLFTRFAAVTFAASDGLQRRKFGFILGISSGLFSFNSLEHR